MEEKTKMRARIDKPGKDKIYYPPIKTNLSRAFIKELFSSAPGKYDMEIVYKVVNSFVENIEYNMSHHVSGVYITGWGYFGVLHTIQKKVYSKFGRQTVRQQYLPTFLPEPGGSLDHFTMDYNFSTEVESKIKHKLLEGFRYLFFGHYFIKEDVYLKPPDEDKK